MMKSLNLLTTAIFTFAVMTSWNSSAGGWCGESKKEDCGDWIVQMAVFNGGAMGSNDCVSYTGCVTSAQWDWSNTGAWSQLMLDKDVFCGKNNSTNNTKDLNISYNAGFSNAWGQHRIAIVSWSKVEDNCDWTPNGNLYELYLHERSYNEDNIYADWCTYKGESPSCSGSTYKLYDCGEQIIAGVKSIRAWRNNPRTSGTTDVDCLWEAWKAYGVPNLYYYFNEIGAEVGPNSGGTFNVYSADMQRVAESSSSNIFYLKNKHTGQYLRPATTDEDSYLYCTNKSNNDWFKWEKLSSSSGYFYLKNKHTGKFFRPSDDKDGSMMIQKPQSWNGSWTQWREVTSADGSYLHIQNRATGKYFRPVSETNTNLEQRPTSWNGNWTRWALEYTSARISDNGLAPALVEEGLSIYPNPASEFLNVSYADEYSISVYNLNGSVMLDIIGLTGQHKLDISNFAPGLYMINVRLSDGSQKVEKIVIR